ncbi:MAG: C25 family cysteine peptidase, partial [Candidatus Tectomicrobia bacterium]|nr:C25 family cysteine peptidase [Candidatus Tectomicrobia bacterium]
TPLQTLREHQGWSVALIDVQDLYDAWSFGHKAPHAMSAFLQHAVAHWQTAPRFVLLMGDASFDPRDYLDQGPSDWIPTAWVHTAEMETASDDALADLDGDGAADLAIGRLPVRNAAEADHVVAKLLAYDAAEGDWQGRTLVVTDSAGDFDFAGAMQPLVQHLAAATTVTTLSVGTIPLDDARQQLYEYLGAGQLLVTYLGHGSVERWHPQGLLSTSAVHGLANSPRLPVVLAMTCLNGFFHDLYTESIAESLIRAPQGGAVAVWASSGLTRPSGQTEMQRALVTRLLSDERPTLGEAIRAAKASIADADVRRTWILLGDPTLRLPLNSTETSSSPGASPLGTDADSSRGGGGCTLSPGTTFDPVLLSILGFIGVYFACKQVRGLSYRKQLDDDGNNPPPAF